MTKKITLTDVYKGFTLDQDKWISPEETLAKFREKLKQVNLDILAYTQRIDNQRLGIPVFFSVCGKDAAALTHTKKQMGKGATPEQAEASATIELAERFSFFSFRNNPDHFQTASYADVQKDAMPYELIAKSVHDESGESLLVKPFFEKLQLSWTPAFNLTRGQSMLIPFDWFYTINEFNGTSAGNCMEEALCQGICEVVERHVSALISRNRMTIPLIQPESATDPMVKDMLAKYAKAGIRLFISDFTLDTGIPTVAVLAHDPSTFPKKSEIVWTAGTTPSPEKALSRALTEVAQLAGDFNTGANYVASGLPKFKSLDEADYIIHPEKMIPLQDLPDISSNNIKTEVENCVSMLARKNLDVISVETTHPLLKVPAFYTLVPGAHFRERSMGASMGLFTAKMITEQMPAMLAFSILNDFDRALPGKYYVNFYKGLCLVSMEQPSPALDFFAKALKMNPTPEDIPSIYAYMGICFRDMEKYGEALNVLKKACEYDNERPDVYNLMGFCHFKLKEHEAAIEAFQKVIRLNPGSAIDYANIASNYRDMGNVPLAIEYYRKALSIDPALDFALKNLLVLSGGNL
jgi:ribosomal protein S12 methylthiotransferase accessory factor